MLHMAHPVYRFAVLASFLARSTAAMVHARIDAHSVMHSTVAGPAKGGGRLPVGTVRLPFMATDTLTLLQVKKAPEVLGGLSGTKYDAIALMAAFQLGFGFLERLPYSWFMFEDFCERTNADKLKCPHNYEDTREGSSRHAIFWITYWSVQVVSALPEMYLFAQGLICGDQKKENQKKREED